MNYQYGYSEKVDNSHENVPSTPDNANNNTDTPDSPADERKAMSNNNWWGSWINSAKSKVTKIII